MDILGAVWDQCIWGYDPFQGNPFAEPRDHEALESQREMPTLRGQPIPILVGDSHRCTSLLCKMGRQC